MALSATALRAGLALALTAACAAIGCGSGSPATEAGEATAATARLGIAYGPYLGVRCRRAGHHGCDLVGIDVVLRRAADRVVALIGGRRLRLRTPGMHNGVRSRDWVGTLVDAGLERSGSPFRIPDNGRAAGVWAGSPPVHVPVELHVTYADGRHARALLPRVFLSPGWG